MNVSDKLKILKSTFKIKNNKRLAEIVGIPYTTLMAIIKNETDDIKLSTARKICDFFDLTLDEFLDDSVNLPEYEIVNNTTVRKSPKKFLSDNLDKLIPKINENLSEYSEKDITSLLFIIESLQQRKNVSKDFDMIIKIIENDKNFIDMSKYDEETRDLVLKIIELSKKKK